MMTSKHKKTAWKAGPWGALALAAGLVLPMQAQAQNILLLTTDEGNLFTETDNIKNLINEFTLSDPSNTASAPRPGVALTRAAPNILSQPNSVGPAIFRDGAGNPYDIVIVATGVAGNPSRPAGMHASNWSALQTAIETRAANSFIMFVDGCCNQAGQMDKMVDLLTAVTPATQMTASGTTISGPLPLNTNSPYHASFGDLNPMYGVALRTINATPAKNVLYLSPGQQPPVAPPDDLVNGASGVFFPVQEVNGGQGACLFGVTDISVFGTSENAWGGTSGPRNQGRIAPAFLNAAKAGGACGLAGDIRKAFSPGVLPAGPGGDSTLTITVGNAGTTVLGSLNVTDHLPAPLQVAGTASTTCTGGMLTAAAGSSQVRLADSSVPVGGCTITVPVRWPAANAATATTCTTATNTIVPGVDFTVQGGQVNTPATATLQCTPAADLRVSLTGLPPIRPGQPYSGSFTCTNRGNGPATGNTQCGVTGLPPGLAVACTVPASQPWTNGDALPEGSTVTCTVTGTPTAAPTGPITGTAGPSTQPGGVDTGTQALPSATASIPTLSQWGMVLLAGLLALLGWRRAQRTQA